MTTILNFDIKETREQRTFRFLSTGLLRELEKWRQLTANLKNVRGAEAKTTFKAIKEISRKIHKIIKENDLITSLVWSFGNGEQMKENDINL